MTRLLAKPWGAELLANNLNHIFEREDPRREPRVRDIVDEHGHQQWWLRCSGDLRLERDDPRSLEIGEIRAELIGPHTAGPPPGTETKP